ncbi:putative Histidine kinase [Candidatus Terasakiella magnetica]|uniref:Chemotaxis protein CheA n=1 Tax=Candidatus Terasakiella magnetica TaxID=1867952 RepID=A0A1C3RI16_9PROT|nr:ATP-binding protein [Candidatus Terasakiella magnetica]SCA56919.1 putative Histidine kinase [Candidatus Terasakiella magnetica]
MTKDSQEQKITELEARIASLESELEEAQDSEQRFLDALKVSPMALCQHDTKLSYTWLYNSHMGFVDNEVIGKTDWDILPTDLADRMGVIKKRVLKTGVAERVEIPSVVDSPDAEYFDLVVHPITAEDSDEVIGLTCGGIDVTERKKMEKQIQEARDAALISRQHIADLLDSSGQGFISFGKDMIVGSEYSKACNDFFQCKPEGLNVLDLFYTEQEVQKRELFKESLISALGFDDEFAQGMVLSLLPACFEMNSYVLKVEYKVLQSSKIMIVLTDITKETNLKNKLEGEYNRLNMIVTAASEQGELFEVISDFRAFLAGELEPSNWVSIYRQIHTFKGHFNQYSFIELPLVLHDIEQEIQQQQDHVSLSKTKMIEALETDLQVITDILGEDFIDKKGYSQVSNLLLDAIKQRVAQLREQNPAALSDANINELLEKLDSIYTIDFKQMLKPLARGTYSLAERFDKKINIDIHGDEIVVEREKFHDLASSLIHVFRNAVDHGIEDEEERDETGKDEIATIDCHCRDTDGEIILQIKDDGQGIEPAKIKDVLISKYHMADKEVDEMSDQELLQTVFDDQFSSRDEVTEVSGRGVGLSATRMVVEEFGGTIAMSSVPGQWSMVEVRIPRAS